MEHIVGPLVYVEDSYRRERLAKDYARAARRQHRLRTVLGRVVGRARGDGVGDV
jgi:hypothetical protein